jgi:drug/metabolite transporter (DMT)-like permease
VLNRKATREEPEEAEFRPRLILDLLRRRVWLAAAAIMLLSFVLGAAALGTGQLATVQILIILELPMTLIGAAKFLGSRLGIREWAAIAGMTGGVIGLLVCLDPRSGPVLPITAAEWIAGSAATAGPAVFFVVMARRTRSPAGRAALLGLATGLGYGLAAAYTKGMTRQFAADGIFGVLASWELYAAAGAGIWATWLLQNAYHAGRLAAAQPGITFLDPAAATAWGSRRLVNRSAAAPSSCSPWSPPSRSLSACSCSAVRRRCGRPRAPTSQRTAASALSLVADSSSRAWTKACGRFARSCRCRTSYSSVNRPGVPQPDLIR